MLAILLSLIIIILIIVIYYVYKKSSSGGGESFSVSGNSGKRHITLAEKRKHAINSSMKDHIEHFTECASKDDPAACDEFLPGKDFATYVADTSIDEGTRRGHRAFVEDRLTAIGQNITGKTFTPSNIGEMEGIDSNPWTGLKRPEEIPGGQSEEADTLSDYNPNAYLKYGTRVRI